MDQATKSNKRKSDGDIPKDAKRPMSSHVCPEQGNSTTIAPEPVDSVYHVVYAHRFNAATTTEAIDRSHEMLQRVNKASTLRVETTTEGPVVVNPEGLNYARTMVDAKERAKEVEKLQAELHELQARDPQLEAAWDECVAVRRRFIATYKRDNGLSMGLHDDKVIEDGNMTAHGGSCIIDARICHEDPVSPTDRDAARYNDIKGDSALAKTIDGMNRHASAVSNKRKTATQTLRETFATFITELQTNGITNDWNPNSAVGKAYDDFTRANTYKHDDK
ncbi:uncharacterized protein APUU_70031S [Aspergillus puulaauensis]|uniref:Uncharacterized protein n=1 Tax=Aspergillus puulaauensis TaxID=1220207 RepID=A0A7R7XVR5_9EURO|nr:uncharacterized protein APUU_70031S [Aspergillus puulaauensis]BCS28461.1 hypothetical protein APUU_70031S [Aspergillus puulaauensis]